MSAPTVAPPRLDGRRPSRLRTPSASTQAPARHRGRVAAGAALLAVSAILAVLVYGNLGDREPVLAVAADVRPGEVIEPADLRVVRVAAEGDVATVAAHRIGDIVGKRAAVGLSVGSLLAPSSVTEGPPVAPGSTVIGAVVKPGQYPIGLRPGDAVVVLVAADGAEGGGGVDAVIVSVSSRTGAEGTAIALGVPASSAPTLARAGAQGRLILTQPVR